MKTKALFVIMYVAGCLVMSAQAQQEEVPPPEASLQTSFETPDLTNIRIMEDPGETLEYIGKIGNDFDTALDSLKTLKNITSEIIKEPLAVIFDYDDRLFFGIIYGDCGMYSDVIDTKGNYYLRTWYCSDDGMTVLPKAYQQTSFNMFNQLATDPESDDNICFSPLSVQIALSMVQNGADGNTLKEMQTALGTYGYSNEEINAFNQSLITSITTRPPFDLNDWKWYVDNDEEEARKYYDAAYPTCEIANSVWYRPDVRINDSFIDILKSSYDGGIGSVEFDTEEGIGEINRWVNDKTHGMIPKIYEEPQSDELAVVLANALYFKGSWSDQFDAGMTKPDVFHCGDGSAVKTDMMCSMSEYHAAVNDKFRMLTLFYGRKDYSMTLFVPVEGTTLPELTSDDWQQTMTEAYEQEHQPYAVYMPKFDFNGKYNLKSVLMKMGINDAFDEYKADFTKMYADHNRAIDKVFQLSRISVDEEGTEAAAVTVIEMPDCAGPDPDDYKEFRVDRPFYFTIENRKQQSVLFVGRVAKLEGETVVEDGFVDKSEEGIDLLFNVINRQEMTAMVIGLGELEDDGELSVLTIPATAKGFSVVSVGEGAFKECPFESVVISEGVKRIEKDAFFNCPQLKKIKLPSTIEWLGSGSFVCKNLEEVVAMMDNPITISDDVFDLKLISADSYESGSYLYGVYQSAMLYVPEGKAQLYQDKTTWNYFDNIRELTPAGNISLSDANLLTAFDMFNKLKDTKENTDNICFSPLSAQLALCMVTNGADGNTLKEMHSALGTDAYTDDEVNEFNQSLVQSLTTRPPFDPKKWDWYGGDEEEARKRYEAAYPVCEIANSVWHRPDVTLYDSFTDILTASYDAGFGAVWFNTMEGIGEINRWVDDKTHGMIPKLYEEPQSDDLSVVLADALYFKGAWSNQFDKNLTQPGTFHLSDGTTVQTDMMCAMECFSSTFGDKFRTITLPYGGGEYSMTLFVPHSGTTLPKLTCADWLRTIPDYDYYDYIPYRLYLPRFDFKGKHDLVPVLKKMGIKDAFGDGEEPADFSRMTDLELFISKVYQLSNISVDEEGTEAAAVTVIEMDKGVPDPNEFVEFRVDRPFYFTIENRKQQSVLFVGRVATLEGEAIVSHEGDVNGDGEVNISDVVAIINAMAGHETHKSAADVNGDKTVDISDVVAVINIMAGQ